MQQHDSGFCSRPIETGFQLEDHLPRSALYCLTPFGLDCPLRESLISYLVRLARAHCVNPRHLIKYVFAKADSKIAELCYNSFFVHYSGTANGAGRYARQFARTANSLTSRTDLEGLTMLPWSSLIPENSEGLLVKHPRWCSHCFSEQISASGESYVPLLWALELSSHCQIHKCAMQDRCHHCGRHQPFIPRVPDAARCDHCGESLIDQIPTSVVEGKGSTERHQEDVATKLLGAVLCRHGEVQSRISLSGFHTSLRRAIQDLYDGNRAKFCRSMGWNIWAANGWLDKGKKPSFPKIVELGLKFDTNPIDLCCGANSLDSFDPGQHGHVAFALPMVGRAPRPKLTEHQRTTLRQLLLEALDSDRTAPSLREVGSKPGLRRSSLKYWFPDLCKRICKKRATERHAMAGSEKDRRASVVTNVVRVLMAQGIYPVRRRVDVELKKYGLALARPELFQTYIKAIRHH